MAPTVARSDAESPLTAASPAGSLYLADTENPAVRKTYIVQLVAPPAAEQLAAMRRPTSKTTAAGAARMRFDKNNATVRGYTAQLEGLRTTLSSLKSGLSAAGGSCS